MASDQGRLLQSAQRRSIRCRASPSAGRCSGSPATIWRIAPRRPSRRFSPKCSTGIRRTRRPAQASTSAPRIYDAVDLVWRNRVGETHNINPYLGRIQSRTLVMHITNDLWLNFKLAQRAVDSIPGADLIAEECPVAHYGVFSIVNNRKHDPKFVAFLEDVARLEHATAVRREELSRRIGRDRYRPEQVVLEGVRDLSLSGQIRDREGQHGYVLADRLHGRVCRHRSQPAGLGGRPWQGCVCRALRQHDQAGCSERHSRHRARSAALWHVRSRQSRQEPGAIDAGHAGRRVTTWSSTSSASSRRSISVTRSVGR